MFRDYRDQVDFFYVYKRLAHPETNNLIEPANIQERIKHIEEAQRLTGTEIPWLCDSMDSAATKAFGETYNGEFVIAPGGNVVRQRFWSNPRTLRSDLAELIGEVEKPTQIADLPVRFRPEPRKVASGVVERLTLPPGLQPVEVEYLPMEPVRPLFVKLRAEVLTQANDSGKFPLYLGFYPDPIHRVHWNNAAGAVTVQINPGEDGPISKTALQASVPEESADCDPRMFLVDLDRVRDDDVLDISLRYVICDDAETFCFPVKQDFKVTMKRIRNGSTRPGVFLERLFGNVRKFDSDGDGSITPEELGQGNVTMYMTHLDYNLDDVIDSEEVERFNKMYNNGRGIVPAAEKDD
ncbi:MAG: hypothetical protein AAGG44_04905 [Planctomycetota bacterium]